MSILNKEKILELARAFIEEGKFDKAIREYEKLLLADPTDLRIKLRIAELYTKRKQINEAIRIYREVAGGYTAEGFFLKAVTVFKNILRLNPAMIEVNEELAGLYERMGLTADAVRQYDILASALDMKGMHERVVDIRRKIVQLNPKDGSARIRLAELCQREGKIDEAIDQYEAYSKQLEESQADRGKLADLYEKILAHRPSNFEMMRKLIGIYASVGDHKKALKWLEQGQDMVESDPDLLQLQAGIYASQNQTETARVKYMMLADLYKGQGNIDAALDAFLQILVMLPDEEERLADRVEELRPGAVNELIELALVRRQELEAEEQRRQEAEDRGEKLPEEETLPPGKRPAPKAAAAEEKPQLQAKAEPAEEAAPAPAAVAPQEPEEMQIEEQPKEAPRKEGQIKPAPAFDIAANRKKADASFELGFAYRSMGLGEESVVELRKALAAYMACLDAGCGDAAIRERISMIEAKLAESENKGVAKPPPEAKPEIKSEPKKEARKQEQTKEQKKKRISFV